MKSLFWLIYSEEDVKKNSRYIEFYREEAELLGLNMILMLTKDIEIGVSDNELYLKYKGDYIEKPLFAIVRTIYPFLNKHLELMSIKTYNNSFVSEICNDKAKTYQYISGCGIKTIDTAFTENKFISERIKDYPDNYIIKSVAGHGGAEVFKVSDYIKEDYPFDITKSDAVIQPYIYSNISNNKSSKDLRVYVIGNDIIAAVLRSNENGYKANFSLGGQVELYKLNNEEITIVNKIIKKFKFGLVGIDFLINESGQLIFNEIEDVVGARMLYTCSDVNIVKLYLKYIITEVINEI